MLLVVLLACIITPFLIWGDWFERLFDLRGTKQWMEGFGPFAWLGGVALLVSDLVLPIPGTVVMSALGLVYGWFWGGLASVFGSVLSGVVAYGLCRKFGHRAAVWLAGEEGLAKGEALFQSERGGWLVALSRWMPVLPEAVACLAGLTRMPWRTFITALIAGSIPLGFVFAAIGDLGLERPGIALSLSALIPVVLYALAAWMLRKKKQ
ncbi:MAG: hypothetical protein RL693_598 [Verrucomicrobiota bacterium]|jgi:uncharacterized membrane protein YdjX (TVP38/TMEM64 family)